MSSRHDERALLVVGWREWLALPSLGIDAIRAKIDTGARSSALHVDALETFERNGREHVRFCIHPGRTGDPVAAGREAPVLDRRTVTDSGGNRTLRIFIRATLRVGPLTYDIELNLTDRRNMLFPMLLGRTAMVGRLLVDPARSFALGEQSPAEAAGQNPIAHGQKSAVRSFSQERA